MNSGEWVSTLRLKFLTATLAPVILGTSIAYHEGYQLNLVFAFLAFFSIGLVQIGANLSNDYFDHLSGNDEVNTSGSKFSGGSRAIQRGIQTPKQTITLAYKFYGIGLILGLIISISISDWFIALLYLLGTLLAYYYCAGPLRLAYRGFAEISNFLAFGPLITLTAYRIQTLGLSQTAILSSIIPGLLLALVLLINEFPDYKADKKVGKKTLVVLLERKKARRIFQLGLISVFILILLLAVLKFIPLISLTVFFTIPLALKIMGGINSNYENTDLLSISNLGMIRLHLIFVLIFSATLLV